MLPVPVARETELGAAVDALAGAATATPAVKAKATRTHRLSRMTHIIVPPSSGGPSQPDALGQQCATTYATEWVIVAL